MFLSIFSPSFKIPEPDIKPNLNIVCHICMQPGHKAIQCHANKGVCDQLFLLILLFFLNFDCLWGWKSELLVFNFNLL